MTYKFQQIKPQKARGTLVPSMWDDPDWVAEEKFDGDRRIAQFLPNSPSTCHVRFTGTRESVDGTGYVEKTENLPHLNVGHVSLSGTVLDGEIIAPWAKDQPGGKSKVVTSIMGSSPELAIQKQRERGWLEYAVFDCLMYKGKDIRHSALQIRRSYAGRAVKEWGNKYAKLVPQYTKSKVTFAWILKNGGEGVILKHARHTYGNEKLWVKVKGEWNADVVIMGFKPGTGKNKGKVGAIEMGQNVIPSGNRGYRMRPVGTCRGFTDDLMDDMTEHPRKYINSVIEILHNGREPTGAFRHPRFKRFRPDKSPKDCVYREDET